MLGKNNVKKKAAKMAAKNEKMRARFLIEDESEVVIQDYVCAYLLNAAAVSPGHLYITNNFLLYHSAMDNEDKRTLVKCERNNK